LTTPIANDWLSGMRFAVGIFLLPLLALWAAPPVPYYGKVSIDGINYHGSAQFQFSLEDANGTKYWRNGADANESIRVFVVNGRYSVMLGGQGMNPLPPELFLQHEELYLSVSFDKGDGLRTLGPEQLITATPRALVAEVAKKLPAGAITSDMLSPEVLSKLDANQSAAPMGPITLEMLPAEVLADLNKSAPAITSITRDMLPADVLSDLNRTVAPQTIQPSTISPQMIQPSSITTAQLNEQILKYLKPEITLTPQAPGLVFGGQTVTLLSQAEGKFLTYQWHRNGEPIAGATGKSFSISEVNGTLHDGNYSVVVSNDFGSVTSALTSLQVDGTPSAHTVASINMEMIFCPPGTFMMGSPTSESGRGTDETQHQVTLTNGFYLGKYEVTQAQYQTVVNGNSEGLSADPSQFKGRNRPVEKVSWADAQVFLAQLNVIEQSAGRLPTGWKYVLPTEAQWEYACRAGTTTAYSWGNDINSSQANYNWDGVAYDGNDSKQTVEVGQFSANPWGFFDMHGNVFEWVYDWKANYLTGDQTDPEGSASGSARVRRSGSWNLDFKSLRSANRESVHPNYRHTNTGFRVAFQVVQTDTANPEIILTGATALIHSQGLPFIDPGVEAHDARDGNITDQIVVTGTVDMNSTGTYLLTYTVQDAAGNPATATRTVTVTGNRTVDLNATVAMDMIWCPPGTFTMGSPTTEAGRGTNETEHNVTLTKGFYLGKYEVTQTQYEAVMTGNTDSLSPTPSKWPNNPNRPVEKVSWEDAQIFLTRMNAQQSANIPPGWAYVLPTEAQWEYACRAGTTTMYSWGNDINSSRANYDQNIGQTVNAGQYGANPWGFFDMHGNVWEWVSDWMANYFTGTQTDPEGPASGSPRVMRGGSWKDGAPFLRSARRFDLIPSLLDKNIGFRVSLHKSQ
jgi:formylglycine-generating enzyme required for sulfatase activity